MKTIEVSEADSKQVIVVYNLLKEAKFEIKGDALGTAAIAMNWVAELSRRFKDAREPAVAIEEPKKRGK